LQQDDKILQRVIKVDLSTRICGKKFKNPFVLASGLLGNDEKILKRVADLQAGAVVSKSCGLKPKVGNENPTVLAWEHGLINAVGLTNPGYAEETKKLKKLKKLLLGNDTKIIASIFGPTIKDIAKIAKGISNARPDFIELNISCPHADLSVKGNFYSHPEALNKLVKAVKKATKIPIIVKLSPNVTDIAQIAKAAQDGGADALAAINTVMAMLIDAESGKPILSNKIGGLSGPAIRPIALRCVFQIYQSVKIPIIGMGGITTGKDAIEMIMAGASAVGIGSGLYYRGLNIFKKVLREMKEFMQKNNYRSINDFKGIAHEN
jgi:dihydroorotate dehydrogenase (NAD+) catalytic subunit